MIENQYDLMLFCTFKLLLYEQNILWFGLEWHEGEKLQTFQFLVELFL